MDLDDQPGRSILKLLGKEETTMSCSYSFFKLSAVTLLISQALCSLSVLAAGYQLNEISPSLQGNATAGAAAANNDASSMFTNPATLSTLKENQLYLGGSEIMPDISMSNANAIHTVNVPGFPPSSITAPVLGVTSQNSISKSSFVPDGYASWRINNKLVTGLSILAPFGLTTKYYSDSVLRFAAVYSSVKSINITPAISYQIDDQWSVGLGFQAQFMRATFSNFNGPYTGISALDAFIAANNPTYLKGTAWGYGYTVGALYKPDLCTRLGIGYRSQISEQISGNGEQFTSPGGTVPAPSPNFLFNAQTSVNAGIKTPAILTVSAARDISNWTLKASAQLNFWGTFNQLSINMPNAFATNTTIQTKWKNVWLGALGADYRITPAWIVRGGVAYDQTPTQNAYRDPRIPDADRIWLDVGASYMMTKHLSFDGAYTHLFIKNQTVNVTQASGSSANSTLPLEVNQVQANYKGSVDIVALAVRYSFS
jgi:long-chain fatty acid transport protein